MRVVICSKFITFAVTKTTREQYNCRKIQLWFAQNSLPLRWQRQPIPTAHHAPQVVICSKFITFAVTKTTCSLVREQCFRLWFAQNSLPLRWQRQLFVDADDNVICCDLLKIHYLCGDKDNQVHLGSKLPELWFAQNSLPLRWQRQPAVWTCSAVVSCDLLKIHYLCGDKDNKRFWKFFKREVVICSKFITFAVTKTTLIWYLAENQRNVECIRNKKRCCLKRRTHG